MYRLPTRAPKTRPLCIGSLRFRKCPRALWLCFRSAVQRRATSVSRLWLGIRFCHSLKPGGPQQGEVLFRKRQRVGVSVLATALLQGMNARRSTPVTLRPLTPSFRSSSVRVSTPSTQHPAPIVTFVAVLCGCFRHSFFLSVRFLPASQRRPGCPSFSPGPSPSPAANTHCRIESPTLPGVCSGSFVSHTHLALELNLSSRHTAVVLFV